MRINKKHYPEQKSNLRGFLNQEDGVGGGTMRGDVYGNGTMRGYSAVDGRAESGQGYYIGACSDEGKGKG